MSHRQRKKPGLPKRVVHTAMRLPYPLRLLAARVIALVYR